MYRPRLQRACRAQPTLLGTLQRIIHILASPTRCSPLEAKLSRWTVRLSDSTGCIRHSIHRSSGVQPFGDAVTRTFLFPTAPRYIPMQRHPKDMNEICKPREVHQLHVTRLLNKRFTPSSTKPSRGEVEKMARRFGVIHRGGLQRRSLAKLIVDEHHILRSIAV